MKYLTEAELADLLAARQERDQLARAVAGGDLDILAKGQALALAAKLQGFVLEIEQHPMTPLAMGYYEAVVTVRPARVMAERIVR